MKRTCLLTGGAGNLACQLSWRLAESFDELLLVDLAPAPVAAVPAQARYEQCDLVDEPAVANLIASARPSLVIHLASLLSGSCELDRRRAWQVNTVATQALFEAAVASGVETLVFPSSLASYGGALGELLDEDAPQWPDSLYGVTKLACERLGTYYHRRHGLDFRCLRLPIVVSRFAPAGAASAYASRAFVESAQAGQFTFRVRPTTRASLVYVEDALTALVRLAQAPNAALTRRIYNIQALSPSAGEIAAVIRTRWPRAELRFAPDEAIAGLIESWPRQLVDQSARRDWGWQPQFDLDRLADHLQQELGA